MNRSDKFAVGLWLLLLPFAVMGIAVLDVLSGNPVSDGEIAILSIGVGACTALGAKCLGDVLK